MNARRNLLALSGGIGGAKLALGLYQVLADHELTVVCNTGDDFEHLGLNICPDIDTVIYTLAGVANQKVGWGLQGESWNFMQALGDLGGESWFNLGDRDLATHVYRTQSLENGATLAEVCAELVSCFDIKATILPATNDVLRTIVLTSDGMLPFQHYFVRDQCRPVVTGFEFDGMDTAIPLTTVTSALQDADLDAIVICPSNPFISIDPILAVPGLKEAIQASPAPVIAVSPIIGGEAVKGPTAKMMSELNMPVTSAAIAEHYRELIDVLVVDRQDEQLIDEITATHSMRVVSTNTLMTSDAEKQALARFVLELISES